MPPPTNPPSLCSPRFPTDEDGWQYTGADKMLVKPMQTRILLQQIEKLLETHEAKKAKSAGASETPAKIVKKSAPKKAASKRVSTTKPVTKK